MDSGLSRAVERALDAAGVSVHDRPDVVVAVRVGPEWQTIIEQYRLGASDRALAGLLERAIGLARRS